ncbi:hypothetical protein RN001_001622 [Aquatica leii]|uniref:Reverse transcriptase domain-containing protein n=1 Tax=Aquatica leii TaxID=1421715 RepID=A0AAN7PNU0_9COLE|nr:hypothetical protein RN001_001622 [Aquatica leii]
MDYEDYDNKIKTLLQDGTYQPITTDPTTYLEKTTKNKIKTSKLSKEDQQKVIPREKSSKCPKLYGLPKIHKEGAPLRPIVTKQLQPYAEEAESYVKNASHFIERIKDITLEPGHMLVSFDVVSLFTNVPVDETIEIIREKHQVREDIIQLTKHCLKNTYFIYKNQRYRQISLQMLNTKQKGSSEKQLRLRNCQIVSTLEMIHKDYRRHGNQHLPPQKQEDLQLYQ